MTSLRSEPEIHAALVQMLRAQGVALAPRVVCLSGELDVVTADRTVIYEIKYRLSRRALYQALGQVLLYRQCLNPAARAIIVGYATPDTFALLPSIEALGVEVMVWEEKGSGADGLRLDNSDVEATDYASSKSIKHLLEQSGQVDDAEDDGLILPGSQPSSPIPYPLAPNSLHWRVAALAQQQGFKNVPALARQMEIPRQALYRPWKDEALQTTLQMLGMLCDVLRVNPGDFFTWQTGSDGYRRLTWAVKEQAEVRGFRMTTLSHRSGIHHRSMGPIWHDTAQAVALATLARIALTLDGIKPFAIGDVFAWSAIV